jgi:hypothetical protein
MAQSAAGLPAFHPERTSELGFPEVNPPTRMNFRAFSAARQGRRAHQWDDQQRRNLMRQNRAAAVVGSHWGHLAAMRAALHPDRVDGTVLSARSAPFGETNPRRSKVHLTASLQPPRGGGSSIGTIGLTECPDAFLI